MPCPPLSVSGHTSFLYIYLPRPSLAPSLPLSLPRRCGGCGAPGCPRPGKGSDAGRGEPPVPCPGSAGRRQPRPRWAGTSRAPQRTPPGREVNAGPSSARAVSTSVCPVCFPLPCGWVLAWLSGTQLQRSCSSCSLKPTLKHHCTRSKELAHVLGYILTRARLRVEHCLCSTLTLGGVQVSQGPFSPSTYLYVDSKHLSSGLFYPNSLTNQG